MDAETMNDSALGIDPRVLRYDSSADPVAAGRGMVALAYATEAKLMGRLAQENTSWQEVYDAYGRLTAEIGNQGMIASRWIGGIFVDKSFQDQTGSELPLRPVPLMRDLLYSRRWRLGRTTALDLARQQGRMAAGKS